MAALIPARKEELSIAEKLSSQFGAGEQTRLQFRLISEAFLSQLSDIVFLNRMVVSYIHLLGPDAEIALSDLSGLMETLQKCSGEIEESIAGDELLSLLQRKEQDATALPEKINSWKLSIYYSRLMQKVIDAGTSTYFSAIKLAALLEFRIIHRLLVDAHQLLKNIDKCAAEYVSVVFKTNYFNHQEKLIYYGQQK